jgi:Sulfotransferase domain
MAAIDDPIFVRGMSRSGGTLLVTLLDAHRDVAMSYELYPSLLETQTPVDLKSLASGLRGGLLRSVRLDTLISEKNLKTFIVRCERGGLNYSEVSKLLSQVIDEGLDFTTAAGRVRFIELLGLEKMKKEGKKRWGMKCSNDYDIYLSSWKRPYFLNVLRDGRDVLASQLNTGSFKNNPSEVAEGWISTHTKFERVAAKPGVLGRMVRYEELTADPETTLRGIFNFLGLEFDPATLRHNEQNLTVFKASHLSKKRVSSSVDTTKIGRWRKDLSPQQVAEFMAVAGSEMTRLGYEA